MVASFSQDRFDNAVYQEVRIAPNRAGEMRISIKGQAEMSAIGRRINRLLHRAQKHGVDLLRVGPVFGGLRYGLEVAGLGGFA